jgi:dTMP kinase
MTTAILGKLIVFEGIDGTGKSTQITLLARYLENLGYAVVTTREPTDGHYGRKIRQLYSDREQVSQQDELKLFLADRREHVEQLILPSLQQGKIVLCDRYYLSTAAYQGANGFNPLDILQLNDFAPTPDIALLFEVSIATSLRRITEGRGEQLNDFEQAESLTRVKKIFSDLELPYICRIDAENSINEIHMTVVAEISARLRLSIPEPLEQL